MQVFVWFLWIVKSCVCHLKPDIDYMVYEQGETYVTLIHYKDSAATYNDTTAFTVYNSAARETMGFEHLFDF